MKNNPCICIGHLKIIDHLILGVTSLKLKENKLTLNNATLETKPMNSWTQVIDGLQEGNINAAFIPAPIAMDLFASGLDIKLLMFVHRSGSIILKNKTMNLNSITDFKGKTVLIPSKLSIQNMLMHKLLSSAGLKLSNHDDINADVVGEVVNPYLMAEMLNNDQDSDIAGLAVAEPFGTMAVTNGIATQICTTQSLWKDHPCCVFALNNSFIKQNPKAVQEIISLFVKTGHNIDKSHDPEVISMAHNFLGHKESIIKEILIKTDIRFKPSLLIPDIDALNIIQNYMADTMDLLKTKIDMDLFVDSSFILNTISEK